MNRTTLLLAALLFAAAAQAFAAPPSDKPRPAEVPPPPGMNDPGSAAPTPVAQDADAQSVPAQAQDPLAPLPKPDNRLVRDKASRDAAANRDRIAASNVTRRQQGSDTVEEYRQNGHVWMIRIVPQNGPAQVFMDTTGSGRLTNDPRQGPVAPVYFSLYEWN